MESEVVRKHCGTCAHYDVFDAHPLCESCGWWTNWTPLGPDEQPDVTEGYHVTTKDTQIGGSHYQAPIQPIDFIVKNDIKWREANVIKYVFRHAKKNGVEDLRKARHYLDMIIEEYENRV